jgi:hypothetical protein
MFELAPFRYEGIIRMSLRFSLAAVAALAGTVVFAVPASAVMQIVPMPDPNAPTQNTPPDGLFDKTFSDHWQKPSADGQQNQGFGSFHFTASGSNGGYGATQNQTGFGSFHFATGGASGGYGATQNPSAYEDSKQPGSEFYQPMSGAQLP